MTANLKTGVIDHESDNDDDVTGALHSDSRVHSTLSLTRRTFATIAMTASVLCSCGRENSAVQSNAWARALCVQATTERMHSPEYENQLVEALLELFAAQYRIQPLICAALCAPRHSTFTSTP